MHQDPEGNREHAENRVHLVCQARLERTAKAVNQAHLVETVWMENKALPVSPVNQVCQERKVQEVHLDQEVRMVHLECPELQDLGDQMEKREKRVFVGLQV